MANKLTDKQKVFCEEYIIDLNGKQAAIRAEYSPRTAESQASRLLSNVKVQSYITELKAARSYSRRIDANYVLDRLVEIDQLDVLDILNDDGDVKPISKWPKPWRTSISGLEISELFEGKGEDRAQVGLLKKIKWPDKAKNLHLLGQHIGVNAFTVVPEKDENNEAPPIAIVYEVAEAVGDIKVTEGKDKPKGGD